jgi:hypothetical protein
MSVCEPLRHADGLRECPLIRVDRKPPSDSPNEAIDAEQTLELDHRLGPCPISHSPLGRKVLVWAFTRRGAQVLGRLNPAARIHDPGRRWRCQSRKAAGDTGHAGMNAAILGFWTPAIPIAGVARLTTSRVGFAAAQ